MNLNAFKSSPSSSVSFAKRPGASKTTVPPSSTFIVSSTPIGQSLTGLIIIVTLPRSVHSPSESSYIKLSTKSPSLPL